MSLPTERCPQCGAAVIGRATWCTLCYAELRPGRVAVPAAVVEPAGPVAASASAPLAPRRGRHAAPAEVDPAPAEVDPAQEAGRHAGRDLTAPSGLTDAQVDRMMAELAAQEAADPLPLAGLLRRLANPGARVAVMVGGSLVLTLVIFGLLALVGVLTG